MTDDEKLAQVRACLEGYIGKGAIDDLWTELGSLGIVVKSDDNKRTMKSRSQIPTELLPYIKCK